MKYRNIVAMLLIGAVLSLWAWPLDAAESDNKTVLLKVHVPFAGG